MLLIFLFSLISYNINGKQKVNRSVLNIRVNNIDNAECISSTKDKYFKSFRYIQLESDTNMLIGKIDKILYENDRIYIMDSRVTRSLFIFDKEGNFINKIDCHGQGPNEFIELTDMFYDSRERTINILSYVSSNNFKIMVFDSDGNALLKQIPINLHLSEVMKFKDGFFVCNSKHVVNALSSNNRLTIYSDNLKKLYDAIPIIPQWRNRMGSVYPELFMSKNGDIFCAPENTTDVYRITADSTFLNYHFDFGKHNYPKEFNTPEQQEKMSRNFEIVNYVTKLYDFYESDNFIVSIFLFKGAYNIAFYDKSTTKVETYLLLDNPLLTTGFGDSPCINKNFVITRRSPDSFLHLFENPSVLGKDTTEKLKKLFKKPIMEDDNPILCVYEFAFQ